MVGWGAVISRVLRIHTSIGWAQRGCIGFAFSACFGGVLDLLGLISRPGIITLLTVGALASLYDWGRSSTRRYPRLTLPAGVPRLAILVVTIAGMLLTVRVAGSVVVLRSQAGLGSFNNFDDFQAYMVYPLKMIETGSMRADPFSIRRTPSHSYGGGAFLQTFIVTALPVQNLRLLDVGLGTILIVGLLWSYMSQLGASLTATAFVLIVFLAIPPPLVNTTSLLIPFALFLGLGQVFVCTFEDASPMARAILVGVFEGAICVLKTSLIPAAVIFVSIQSCLAILRAQSKARATRDSLISFAIAALATLPWLLDARRWTGTFVPTSLTAYHAHPTLVAAIQRVTGWHTLPRHVSELPLSPYIVLVVLAGILLVRQPTLPTRDIFWSLLTTAVLGSVGITLAVGGAVNDLDRFTYPFVIAAVLIGLAQVSVEMNSFRLPRAVLATLAVTAVAVILTFSGARKTAGMYRSALSDVLGALRGRTLIAAELAAKYHDMQRASSPSSAVLARLDYPFLLNFKRNRILIIDIPGEASLTPGVPYFQGSEALAKYLTSQGIRYAAYDYATEASAPQTGPLGKLANDDRYPVAQAIVRLSFDLQDNLKELGKSRARVYDDGTAFVLDLLEPADSSASKR